MVDTASTTDTTLPPAEEEESGMGGWLKKNWMALVAGLLGIVGLMSGAAEGMLLGLILVGVAVAAMVKPEMFGEAKDAVSGLWNKGVDGWNKGVEGVAKALNIGPAPVELTSAQLADPVPNNPKMTQDEKEFEQWALNQVGENKITTGTQNLKTLLGEMREGEGNLNLDKTTADEAFFNGLPEGLKSEARAKLDAVAPSK